jgi:hypothetical protein
MSPNPAVDNYRSDIFFWEHIRPLPAAGESVLDEFRQRTGEPSNSSAGSPKRIYPRSQELRWVFEATARAVFVGVGLRLVYANLHLFSIILLKTPTESLGEVEQLDAKVTATLTIVCKENTQNEMRYEGNLKKANEAYSEYGEVLF